MHPRFSPHSPLPIVLTHCLVLEISFNYGVTKFVYRQSMYQLPALHSHDSRLLEDLSPNIATEQRRETNPLHLYLESRMRLSCALINVQLLIKQTLDVLTFKILAKGR